MSVWTDGRDGEHVDGLTVGQIDCLVCGGLGRACAATDRSPGNKEQTMKNKKQRKTEIGIKTMNRP